MKRRFTIAALAALAMMMALISAVFAGPSPTQIQGAKQIAGVGSFAAPGACTDPEGQGADFEILLAEWMS